MYAAASEESNASRSVLLEPDASHLPAVRTSADDAKQRVLCEVSKENALKDPIIRTLVDAVESYDCGFNSKRSISCRRCIPNVSAGFSSEDNHVILCQNACTSQRLVTVNLGHELVHAYDNCRAKVDFTNIRHLACTEIRAANLMHCRSRSLATRKSIDHKDCVKTRALRSVQLQTGVGLKRAESAVDSVFDHCYNDLSPFNKSFNPGVRHSRRNYAYY